MFRPIQCNKYAGRWTRFCQDCRSSVKNGTAHTASTESTFTVTSGIDNNNAWVPVPVYYDNSGNTNEKRANTGSNNFGAVEPRDETQMSTQVSLPDSC